MIRKLIQIDEQACNGCGACAAACHEGAIAMVDGKAKLMREDYCDGLGDCLPACPVNAIRLEEREALAYDAQAVQTAQRKQAAQFHGCPGARATVLRTETGESRNRPAPSRLSQWPVQIQLAPVQAAFFQGAKLLIAADCTAYAYGNFHEDFIKDRIVLIGCPKLDRTDYREKLAHMISSNAIESITVVRMEVPCCGGLEYMVKQALQDSGKEIPCQVVTISTDGTILR